MVAGGPDGVAFDCELWLCCGGGSQRGFSAGEPRMLEVLQAQCMTEGAKAWR